MSEENNIDSQNLMKKLAEQMGINTEYGNAEQWAVEQMIPVCKQSLGKEIAFEDYKKDDLIKSYIHAAAFSFLSSIIKGEVDIPGIDKNFFVCMLAWEGAAGFKNYQQDEFFRGEIETVIDHQFDQDKNHFQRFYHLPTLFGSLYYAIQRCHSFITDENEDERGWMGALIVYLTIVNDMRSYAGEKLKPILDNGASSLDTESIENTIEMTDAFVVVASDLPSFLQGKVVDYPEEDIDKLIKWINSLKENDLLGERVEMVEYMSVMMEKNKTALKEMQIYLEAKGVTNKSSKKAPTILVYSEEQFDKFLKACEKIAKEPSTNSWAKEGQLKSSPLSYANMAGFVSGCYDGDDITTIKLEDITDCGNAFEDDELNQMLAVALVQLDGLSGWGSNIEGYEVTRFTDEQFKILKECN